MLASLLTPTVIADLVSELRASPDAAPTRTVRVPFTGETLHELPQSTIADVTDAAARARLAQLEWHHAGFAHRRAVLLRAHDLLLQRRELLMDAVQLETGKTRGQAFEELFQGVTATRYYALAARPLLRTRRRRGGIPFVIQSRVSYRPKGVVGVITPWNYPLSLALMDVVPALASANGVVQKTDDQSTLSVLAARRAFIDAGLPPELWAVVTGGSETGNAVNDASDFIAFTGSTRTGIAVGTRAMASLKGSSLELGGKNPLIVLDDVHPERIALTAAYACFTAAGQQCTSIERIFVMRSVADRFIPAFADATRSLVLGSGLDHSADVGSLALDSQLQRAEAHVADAVAKGATVLAGGVARPDLGPLFFEPTVLTGVSPDMDCYATETFAPVVAVTVVDSVAEAIAAANDTAFGLNASIFSSSRARARRIAHALDAGSVNINEGYRASFSSIDAPMGGIKQSGLGRRNGPEGLLRFVDSRTIGEVTGLITLPRTGREYARLTGAMILALRVFRMLRRR